MYVRHRDFDGDCMNFSLPLDEDLADGFERLSINHSASDFTGPRKVSSNVQPPKTVMATFSNFVHSDKEVDPEKYRKMQEMYSI